MRFIFLLWLLLITSTYSVADTTLYPNGDFYFLLGHFKQIEKKPTLWGQFADAFREKDAEKVVMRELYNFSLFVNRLGYRSIFILSADEKHLQEAIGNSNTTGLIWIGDRSQNGNFIGADEKEINSGLFKDNLGPNLRNIFLSSSAADISFDTLGVGYNEKRIHYVPNFLKGVDFNFIYQNDPLFGDLFEKNLLQTDGVKKVDDEQTRRLDQLYPNGDIYFLSIDDPEFFRFDSFEILRDSFKQFVKLGFRPIVSVSANGKMLRQALRDNRTASLTYLFHGAGGNFKDGTLVDSDGSIVPYDTFAELGPRMSHLLCGSCYGVLTPQKYNVPSKIRSLTFSRNGKPTAITSLEIFNVFANENFPSSVVDALINNGIKVVKPHQPVTCEKLFSAIP